jgi:cobalt/nickel transport system permease protein
MHMANELLSVPVAAGTIAVAAGGVVAVCRRAAATLTSDRLPLMGIMGAFVFAAQMVNFQLPLMPGTSGHMVGAVLLAILLGPHAGALVMTSIIIVQCLLFQDGGLLALGCNIINMGLVPSYFGYGIFRALAGDNPGRKRLYFGSVAASVAAVEAGAILVPVEARLSGVLQVPFATFLATMAGVHLLIGVIEGLITAFVLGYLREVRPELAAYGLSGRPRMSAKGVYVTLAVSALVLAGGLSLLASANPDGLEWSYKERPDQPDFQPAVENASAVVAAVERLQETYTPLPDYSVRAGAKGQEQWAGWKSFVGVAGSAVTMAVIWLGARLLRARREAAEAGGGCTTRT